MKHKEQKKNGIKSLYAREAVTDTQYALLVGHTNKYLVSSKMRKSAQTFPL